MQREVGGKKTPLFKVVYCLNELTSVTVVYLLATKQIIAFLETAWELSANKSPN